MPDEASAPDALFDAAVLGDWLGKPGQIVDARAVVVERVVWGWLKPALGLTSRPSAGTADLEQVFAWAIELGGIAHENPAGHSRKVLGTKQQDFSAERRAEILREAADFTSGGGVAEPQGSFPPAPVYPDPVRWSC